MGSSPKSPPPPDYRGLAQQQADIDKKALQDQTVANRPDQYTPQGSLTWQMDPTTGKWTSKEQWSPEVQKQYDDQMALQGKRTDQISGLLDRPEFQSPSQVPGFNPYQMTTPAYDQESGNAFADKYAESLLSRIRPQQQADQGAMENKLRMQGLQPGTAAYNRAYTNLLTSQGDVTAQAQLQGQLAGSQEARNMHSEMLKGDAARSANNAQNYTLGESQQNQAYQQAMQNYLLPWQTANMVPQASIMTPQFGGVNQAGLAQGANQQGAAQQSYAQQMQQYNDAVASRTGKGSMYGAVLGGVVGSIVPGIGTAAGAAVGGAAGGALYSDPTLKDGLAPMSDEDCYNAMKELVPMEWKWTGTNVVDRGISATQASQILPTLVNKCERGLLKVSYTGLFAILLGAFRHLEAKENSHAAA